MRGTIEQRFWAKVRKTETCWLWTASTNYGYGQLGRKAGESNARAHRLSWELHFGPISDPNLFVCHKCDVNYPPGDITYRRCVRPDHLFLGTIQDNTADMHAKGRGNPFGGGEAARKILAAHPEMYRRGERHANAKLNDKQVCEIRARRLAGEQLATLADEFHVSKGLISHIALRRGWTHL